MSKSSYVSKPTDDGEQSYCPSCNSFVDELDHGLIEGKGICRKCVIKNLEGMLENPDLNEAPDVVAAAERAHNHSYPLVPAFRRNATAIALRRKERIRKRIRYIAIPSFLGLVLLGHPFLALFVAAGGYGAGRLVRSLRFA